MKWALLSLFFPFAAALLLLFFGRRAGHRLAGGTVVVVSALCLAAAWLALVEAGATGEQILVIGGWEAPLAIRFHLTPLVALLVGFVSLIHLLVGMYTLRSPHNIPGDYWPLSSLLHGALVALLLSADIFNLYITLELLSLVAVALVILSGPRAYRPALNYLLLSLCASLCYLLGVALLYGLYGVLDIPTLKQAVQDDRGTGLALLLMTVGLMLKAALWPLHWWLPPAHASAPTAVSALLSALVVKGPLYILWVLWSQVAPVSLSQPVGAWFAAAGGIALVSGGWSALRAPFIKSVVAYSTVAQLGYALMALGLLLFLRQPQMHVALWLFVVAHGLAKTSMFLAAGEMQKTLGTRRVAQLKGATQTLPVAMFAFAVAGGSLVGFPPSGGFLAKWVLLEPILSRPAYWPWATGILLGTVVSAAYVFRTVALGFDQAPGNRAPVKADRVAQWLAMLPALLVWGMALTGERLIYWLTGATAQ